MKCIQRFRGVDSNDGSLGYEPSGLTTLLPYPGKVRVTTLNTVAQYCVRKKTAEHNNIYVSRVCNKTCC